MCLDPTHAPDGQDRVLIQPMHLTGRIASPATTGNQFIKGSGIAPLRLPYATLERATRSNASGDEETPTW